jgi:type I restriction enzyme M protein
VADIGARVNAAMREIEKHNPQLAGVLPKTYNLFTSTLLKELLKKVSEIPATLDYDAFGRIYEYFLGAFAMTEGQGGGEFYTPSSIVKLLAEIIEPFHGRILDPACGSGGMFVQSARFVAEHQKNPAAELAICGVEKTDETGRLCRLNLAVHGLEGDIRHGGNVNSYYDDPHTATGVRLRPRQSALQRQCGGQGAAQGHGRRRPPLPLRPAAHRQRQLPVDSALLLGAQCHRPRRLRHGQLGLRRPLQRAGTAAEADRSAGGGCHGRRRPQHVLHRHAALHAVVLRQGQGQDEARRHRALHRRPPHLPAGRSRPPRLDAGADRLHRQPRAPLSRRGARHTVGGGETAAKLIEVFGETPVYRDIPGLCKAATLAEIEAQGWSLNPGRYVGVAPGEEVSDEDFKEQLETLNEELESLNAQARELEQTIAANVAGILEA